ncbi:hypothetical protein CDD83_9540 [Cordyceps sp. RAO-2017]|nr:hypothetical protein CDD83_9540 [Cordyceps sp. RAO-2017]
MRLRSLSQFKLMRLSHLATATLLLSQALSQAIGVQSTTTGNQTEGQEQSTTNGNQAEGQKQPRPKGNQTDGPERSYPGEKIKWSACGRTQKGFELECSSVDVPADQFNKEKARNITFNVPIIRLRRENAKKNLIYGPGGPGLSGIEDIYFGGDEMTTLVGGDYHLMSFDPRGVNSSKPTAECFPTEELALTRTFDSRKLQVEDSGMFAWASGVVKACRDNMGEHGKYINTPQAVADMNSILDAVGQEEMVLWGVSYGTMLAETYAALFPNRSSRIIADSVVHPFEWYDSLFIKSDYSKTMEVLQAFADECVKAGDRCALSSSAGPKELLINRIVDSVKQLGPEPLDVYVNVTTYGWIDNSTTWGSIFQALYSPDVWPVLARDLKSIMQGDGTGALLNSGLVDGLPIDPSLSASWFYTFNDGLSGADWPRGIHASSRTRVSGTAR